MEEHEGTATAASRPSTKILSSPFPRLESSHVNTAVGAWVCTMRMRDHPPRERRNLIQTGVTVAVVVLFTVLIWWRTTVLLAEFGRHLGLG
jgi:hypothetical protein